MPKVPMIAVKRQMYMTRWLRAGDPFMARSEAEAKILKAIGKARDDYDAPVKEVLAVPAAAPVHVPAPAQSPPSSPLVATPPVFVHEETHHEHDPLDALRAEATELGVHVDRRWGEARLAQEIDAALEKSTEKETPETPAAEPHETTAMTTGSASALMPNPWQRDKE